MKRTLIFLILILASFELNAQSIYINNSSNKSLTCTLTAHGSNTGYNTCSFKATTYFTVPANTVYLLDSFYDAASWNIGGSYVSGTTAHSTYGQAVWTYFSFSYSCGLSGTISQELDACSSEYSDSGACAVTSSWTSLGSDVSILVDN